MKRNTVQHLALSAVFAAIICVTTMYLLHIPIGNGYVHLGDTFVYLAGAFLPWPYAMAAAGIGSGLADLLSGAPQWIVFTVVIKAAMAACFTSRKDTVLCLRNVLASVGAGVVCIVGYYFAEWKICGNPLIGMGSLMQSGGGAVLFLFLGLALDRAQIKKRLK